MKVTRVSCLERKEIETPANWSFRNPPCTRIPWKLRVWPQPAPHAVTAPLPACPQPHTGLDMALLPGNCIFSFFDYCYVMWFGPGTPLFPPAGEDLCSLVLLVDTLKSFSHPVRGGGRVSPPEGAPLAFFRIRAHTPASLVSLLQARP